MVLTDRAGFAPPPEWPLVTKEPETDYGTFAKANKRIGDCISFGGACMMMRRISGVLWAGAVPEINSFYIWMQRFSAEHRIFFSF
jgi:hypothetical protein